MKKISFLLGRIKTMSPAAKASIVLMITQLIQKGLSLITSPIFTRLLSTEEYGEVSLFFSWYEILVIFTGLCLSRGVFNNGMMDFKEDRNSFTLSMYVLTFLSTIVVGTCVILFNQFIYDFLRIPLKLIVYMFILLAFEAALSLWTVWNRFEYKYRATSIVTVIIAIISPICGILGIYLFPDRKVDSRIIGARNVFLVAYIIVLIYLIYKAKGKIKTAYWKYALKFNLPLLPHYLSLHILNHVDRIMISSLANNSAAGIYSAAYNGASIVKLFWQAINASLIPWTYEKCEKKDFKRLGEITKVLVMGYGLVCIAFMFLAPEIMKILAPSSYSEGIKVIAPVVCGVYFSCIYYIFANVVYYYKKPKYVMVASVLSAVVNIILNYILIPRYGFVAAGYTTMISYIVQSAIDYWAMKQIIKEEIYDMKFIILFSIFIIFNTVVLSLLYNYTVIRLLIFAVIVTFSVFYLIKNKKDIIELLSNKRGKKNESINS